MGQHIQPTGVAPTAVFSGVLMHIFILTIPNPF